VAGSSYLDILHLDIIAHNSHVIGSAGRCPEYRRQSRLAINVILAARWLLLDAVALALALACMWRNADAQENAIVCQPRRLTQPRIFTARRVVHSAVSAMVRCLSVTRWYSVKTTKQIKFFCGSAASCVIIVRGFWNLHR